MIGRLALAALVAGVVLNVGFETTLTRVTGVTLILAWIVLGLFALLRPEDLAAGD